MLPGGIDLNRKIPIAMTFPAAPELRAALGVLCERIGEDPVAAFQRLDQEGADSLAWRAAHESLIAPKS